MNAANIEELVKQGLPRVDALKMILDDAEKIESLKVEGRLLNLTVSKRFNSYDLHIKKGFTKDQAFELLKHEISLGRL